MKNKLKQFMKNKTAVGVACIGVAITFSIINMSMSGKSSSEKTTTVLVTTGEISAGDKITESMISEIKLQGNIPNNIVTSKDDIVGKYANINISSNDIITEEKLSMEAIYGSAYLENLGDDERAISVSLVSLAVGLSGKLESGDIISVIVTNEENETSIYPELRYVEVVSISDSSGYDINSKSNSSDAKNVGSTITLLVDENQAKILANLEQNGNIHLSLVYRGNDERKQELIEKQKEIIKEIYSEYYVDEEIAEETQEGLTEIEVEEIQTETE